MAATEEETHQSILDGRTDVARALVKKVLGHWADHPPHTDLVREIVDDPYVGVDLILEELTHMQSKSEGPEEGPKEYVVRRKTRSDEAYLGIFVYARVVIMDPKGRKKHPEPPKVVDWHPCKRCAVRLTKDEAHDVAHMRGGNYKVVRMVPKKP